MEAMAKHRTHSAAFKRQVAEEFIAGEALHALSKRHDISRQLIRIWVSKFEAGTLDHDVQAADLLQEYEAKIAALERMVGRQALEIEMLKGALKQAPRLKSGTISVVTFRNRRELASYAGLAPSPWQSGGVDHEQGISKAGNARVRKTMGQLAWLWLRNQPDSALSGWYRERV